MQWWQSAKTCQAAVALGTDLTSWESMNSYHPLQSQTASQEPEVQPKLRSGRKFVLCWWFYFLSTGFNHFHFNSCFAAHQIGKVPLETLISMILFSSTWKQDYQPQNASPAGRKEVTFYTPSPPLYVCVWTLQNMSHLSLWVQASSTWWIFAWSVFSIES